MNVHVTKTVPISYHQVVEAYAKVKQGGKSAGIDGENWLDFERKGVEKELYVIWNRLASGSYHPQAVKEVEIPKKDGKVRKLGIPTIRDRIAQEVIRKYMEQKVDAQFHENSYGYRPLKSAHQALEQVRSNCLALDWVIDMDISKFFDEIDHELLLKAVAKDFTEPWIMMYVKRWLSVSYVSKDGIVRQSKGKGTPQGCVISPLLANLFLHYGLDQWLTKYYPQIRFVRYADDAIIHCHSEAEAKSILGAIEKRMDAIGLRLNTQKTKIVYCKDYRRRQQYEQVQFDFLGYSYQPRGVHKPTGEIFKGYFPEISKSNQVKIQAMIREAVSWRDTTQEAEQIAEKLNNKVRGWLNYYGLFSKNKLYRLSWMINLKLTKWLQRKHKEGVRKSEQRLRNLKQKQPHLFYHWYYWKRKSYQTMTRAV